MYIAGSAYQEIPKQHHDCNFPNCRNVDGSFIFDVAFEILSSSLADRCCNIKIKVTNLLGREIDAHSSFS